MSQTIMRIMMHKEFMSQAIFEKMKILNNKLQNLKIKIFKIASEYDHSLKQRVDDLHDPLQEHEINAKIYHTREQNDLWKREVIVIDQNNLEGITYKKRQIDELEGYPSHYTRYEIDILQESNQTQRAVVYFLNEKINYKKYSCLAVFEDRL